MCIRDRVRIGPVGGGPWRLTMDRTNWQFGTAIVTSIVDEDDLLLRTLSLIHI